MTWRLLCNSLFVGAFTTFLAVGLGFGTALWLGCLPSRWRSLFFGAAIVALAFPPFLVTNCWLHFLGRAGVWRQWLPMDIFSLGGTIWVLTLLLWPLPLLLVWSSWSRLEPAQLESDMQVRGWHLIKYLLFPLAQDALVFGSLLTLVLALNNFSVPAILQVKVLPAEMWIRFNTEFDTVGALRAGYPLLIAPLLLLAWFLKREIPWPHREPSVSSEVFRRQLGSSWFWLSGVCACAALTCAAVLPLIQIMAAPRTWTELPGAIAAGQGAIWNSFWYATVAATLVLVAGLMLATRFGMGIGTGKSREVGLEPKHHSSGLYRFLRAGLRLSWAGGWLVFLTPGVVLGIALIHAFNHAWSSLFYQSAWIV
ncbi:MAG TPA: hypothetical protein VL793_11225, partial [Patescibacteria group bacterium]|nr:hypothetical protein [Patescibacteria group bacterium]